MRPLLFFFPEWKDSCVQNMMLHLIKVFQIYAIQWNKWGYEASVEDAEGRDRWREGREKPKEEEEEIYAIQCFIMS